MECHEVCNLFPAMEAEQFKALCEDIAKHGQIDPIWTYKDQIIDGRNRYNACTVLEIAPKFQEWNGEGGSLIEFVVSRNLSRRHLTASQRAALAVELLPMLRKAARERQREAGRNHGRGIAFAENSESCDSPIDSRERAAEVAHVNHAYVSDAVAIKEADPEAFEEVRKGKLTIPAAKKQARRKQAQAGADKPRRKVTKRTESPRRQEIAVYLRRDDPSNLVIWMRAEVEEGTMTSADVARYLSAITDLAATL